MAGQKRRDPVCASFVASSFRRRSSLRRFHRHLNNLCQNFKFSNEQIAFYTSASYTDQYAVLAPDTSPAYTPSGAYGPFPSFPLIFIRAVMQHGTPTNKPSKPISPSRKKTVKPRLVELPASPTCRTASTTSRLPSRPTSSERFPASTPFNAGRRSRHFGTLQLPSSTIRPGRRMKLSSVPLSARTLNALESQSSVPFSPPRETFRSRRSPRIRPTTRPNSTTMPSSTISPPPF